MNEQVILVKDINSGGSNSFVDNLTVVNETLYFTATDGTNGEELWKSDGTAEGTVLVEDINPGGDSSFPNNFTEVNGKLYFTANDGTNGDELWSLSISPTVYRFFNPSLGVHFYTPSAAERDYVLDNLSDYQLESNNGIAFYVESV
ncbi:ELWxxDGT repeat protein [Myxosarcina sp. GI1]|uniref:ELWxxDGT repeat protein n=1 Tax=Myxosarcina sp. GI1 TaxID=1541065 RepID=UPI00056087EE|nr:ELWxxDGT repeat protein [Myxosarcina sp. GI1]